MKILGECPAESRGVRLKRKYRCTLEGDKFRVYQPFGESDVGSWYATSILKIPDEEGLWLDFGAGWAIVEMRDVLEALKSEMENSK